MMIDNNFFLDTHTFLKKIAKDIIKKGLSVREVEKILNNTKKIIEH